MIRKRICGERRVVLCHKFAGIEAVIKDSALADDMDHTAYADSLFDQSLIKCKPDQTPTYWTVRSMPRQHLLALDDITGTLRKSDWWLRCCLRKLENFETVDDAGQTRSIGIELKTDGDYGEIVSPESMAALQLTPEEYYALAGMLNTLTQAGAGPLPKPSEPQPGLIE